MALSYSYVSGTDSYSVVSDSCTVGAVVIPNTATDGVNGTKPVTRIEDNAFLYCTSLTSITIPSSVTSIGDSAFSGCTGLTGTLTIPNSVTSIGVNAFYYCYGLTGTLTIPNSVTSIGFAAFLGCYGLTSLILPTNVNFITIGIAVFANCDGLTTIIIPNNVTSTSDTSFANCTGLTSITIPKNVTIIANNTFSGCTNLTRINFLGKPPTIVGGVFSSASANLKIYRYSTKSGWSSTFGGKDVLLIDSNIHQGLQTFGFLNTSSGKVSIKKTNTGGGTIDAYKINDYIFSYNSAIDFNTSCSDENGDYYTTQADPYQISFNVNLPKKPKQVQVKLKGVSADDIRYMGIVLTNPYNKPCFINQYNAYNDYYKDRRLTTVASVNALVTDNAQDGLFQTGIGGLLSNDTTGTPYTITGSFAFTCKADHYFTGYIRVQGCQTAEIGTSSPYCGSPPNIISGFLPSVDELAGVGSNVRYYYTKLNKLIDNNYNGTWKISSWNHWAGDPSDVQNYINNGIDLIFKF